MNDNLITQFLLVTGRVPGFSVCCQTLLQMQDRLSQKRPVLAQKVSNFSVVGLVCFLLQMIVMHLLLMIGVAPFLSVILAIEVSVFINYCFHRRITWKDQMNGLTYSSGAQAALWFCLLFLIYNSLSMTVVVKIVGINFLHSHYHLPLWQLVIVFELVCAGVNFVGADRLVFGQMVRLIRWRLQPI